MIEIVKPFPEVQSYSSLRRWLECQYSYALGKLTEYAERSASWASIGGKAVHTLTYLWALEHHEATGK